MLLVGGGPQGQQRGLQGARISSFPVSSLVLRLEASFVLLYRYTVRGERRVPHKLTWRSQHLPLSGIIIVSDYFGGGTWKKLYIRLHCSVS